ncbi:MAG TPA: hypothetical protein PJ992_11265 [Arachnia sp.]|nr:hypothetical protein [Arachnia sp.]
MRIRTGEDEYLEVEDGIEVVDLDTDLYYYDGERLTEARAAAIARDVARRHGLKGGRPPLSAEGTDRIGSRIPKPLRRQLRERAEADHQTESEVVRRALENYLGKAS